MHAAGSFKWAPACGNHRASSHLRTPGNSQMDLQKIRELIDLVSQSSLSELELTEGDESIRLLKDTRLSRESQSLDPQVTDAVGERAIPSDPQGGEQPAVSSSERVCTSPMVGTFYRASSPGEAPFVQVGDHVVAGQTICVVEAMKMLNEVEADVSGCIKSILVENGSFVEYGQALFIVE
jgi:acetyl-CoA carboxylase biotin carboxyl carrier protein